MILEALVSLAIATPSAPPPPKPDIHDVSRAVDSRVVIGSCNYGPPACWKTWSGPIHIYKPIYRTLTKRSCRSARPRALAVFILTHEAGHDHGIYTESGANAYAYTYFSRTARRLDFNPSRLSRALPPLGSLKYAWLAIRDRC